MNEELILAEVNEVAQDNVDIVQDGLTAETSEVETKVAEFDSELDNDIPMEESTVDVLYVGPMEEIEIEVDEAIGWVSGDTGRHYGLPDRNDPDQHIIESITGLREELNEIESLKTVYSDKHNIANYYKWSDGNKYDTHGYFVSLVPNSTEIEICTGKDIFGVSVSAAGFIGGQDALISRDNSYGLVVTSGLVDVRCESNVAAGDYIISNAHGVAEKTTSDCGYKVIAVNDDRAHDLGVLYATIALGVQACATDALGKNLQYLETRVGNNEVNIAAAMNTANEAFNKAGECVVSNGAISDKVDGALGVIEDMSTKVDNLGTQVSSATTASAQAKAIAESAVTSAESMKNEAVAEANKALAETSELRKELQTKVAEIDASLENTALELQATKESIESAKGELQGSIDETIKDIESLEKDLEPLATWPAGSENPTGIAGFVAKADEDSATLASMVEWQGETNESIAAFRQEVSENYATQDMVAAVGDNLASFKQEVEDDYATQEMVTKVDDSLTAYKQEVEKNYATQQMLSGIEDSLASYKQEVTNTYATQQMVTTVSDNLTSYKQEVTDTYATQEMVSKLEEGTTKALADYKQEVTNTYATQEMVTKLETDTGKALTDYKQEVGNTYATQASLTALETNTTKAIAASEEKATATYASKSDLTSFEGNTNIAMARIEQKADANGAYIQSTVSNMDKYSVGPYSQAYGFTLEQARAVLEEGMVYVPTGTETHSEVYTYTETGADGKKVVKNYPDDDGYQFTPGYIYTWSDIDGSEDTKTMMWKESAGEIVSFGTAPSGDAYDFWYTNSDTVSEGYEPYTLYKLEEYKNEAGETLTHWVAVATLAGNSSNRAVSQIRQDANSIELSVSTLDDKYASTKIWVDDNKAGIQDVVSWHGDNGDSLVTFMQEAGDNFASASQVAQIVDKDGNIKAASIVTAVNDSDTSVGINANKIVLDGTTFFVDKNGNQTTINGANITTGSITSDQIATDALRSTNYEPVDKDGNPVVSTSSPPYSTEGTFFDLEDGAIYSKNFCLDEKGDVYLKGKIDAQEGGTIGGFTIGDSSIYKTKTAYNDNTAGVYIGTDGIGLGAEKFHVTSDGALTSTSGTIGGWDISEDGISKGSTRLYSYDGATDLSLANSGSVSPIRLAIGSPRLRTEDVIFDDVYSDEGSIYYETKFDKEIVGARVIDCTDPYGDGNVYSNISATVSNDGYTVVITGNHDYGPVTGNNIATVRVTYKDPYSGSFEVLDDGSLYASAADIEGNIKARDGEIGNLSIAEGGLKSNINWGAGFELNGAGIKFWDNSASLRFGNNFKMGVDSTSGKIQADGPLEIIGQNTSIKLNTEPANNTVNKTFTVYADYYKKEGGIFGLDPNRFVKIWLTSSDGKKLLYNQDVEIKWSSTRMDNNANKFLTSGTEVITWYSANISDSSIVSIQFTNSDGDAQKILFLVYIYINNELKAAASFLTNEHTVGSGEFELYGGSFKQYKTPNNILLEGNLVPLNKPVDDIYYNLGNENNKWHTVFAQTPTIESSDRNLKNNIEPLSAQYSQLFDSLRPVSYKFNENQSGRTHVGLIAQDVEEGLTQAGLTSQDFAGLCYWDKEDGTKGYGLRYGEFIALCIDEIQKLKKRVEELEEEKNK